jgi:hypothetical protein
MRRAKLVLAAAAVMVAMLMAFSAPAMANNNNERNDQHRTNIFNDNCCNNERHHGDDDFGIFDLDDDFSGFLVGEVDVDVDEENVGARNDNEGECFVEEIDWDLDGFIAEWEIDVVCFV